jgi:hypothetical protein
VGDGRVLWILRGSSWSATGSADASATAGTSTAAAAAPAMSDAVAATLSGAAGAGAAVSDFTVSDFTVSDLTGADLTVSDLIGSGFTASGMTGSGFAISGAGEGGAGSAATTTSGICGGVTVGAGAGFAADAAFLAGGFVVAVWSAVPSPDAAGAFLAARLAAFGSSGCSGLVRPSRSARRRRRSPCASMIVEDWLFASTPIAPQSASISVFVIPSSFASSCTRMFFAKPVQPFIGVDLPELDPAADHCFIFRRWIRIRSPTRYGPFRARHP